MSKKLDLIRETNPNRNNIYLRNLFRRHPDLFLTSYSSMLAKINYLKRNVNINLAKEPSFPLLLHYNYSRILWPRCEVLLENHIKHFNLTEVLSKSDKNFCEFYGIDRNALIKKKESRPYKDEKDQLWVYVPGVWLFKDLISIQTNVGPSARRVVQFYRRFVCVRAWIVARNNSLAEGDWLLIRFG